VSMHKIMLVIGFDVKENVTIYINCQLFMSVHMINYFLCKSNWGSPCVQLRLHFFKIDTYFEAWFTQQNLYVQQIKDNHMSIKWSSLMFLASHTPKLFWNCKMGQYFC
jgi:hypothetical protein